MGLAAETEFGAAQDVEWAIDGSGSLYVVQSRPITAPVTIPVAPAVNGRRISWSNANVNENFPRPISPLLYSIASAGYTHYFRNLAVACGVSPARVRAMEPAFRQIIGVHGARMYYNLTSIHSVLRLAPFGDALTKSFDAFVGADGAAVETTDVGRRGAIRQAGEIAVIAARATALLFRLGRRIERFERTVDEFAARAEPSRLERLSLAELRDLLAGFIEIRCHKWLDASLADGAAMISYGALERLLRGAGVDAAVHTSLLKAIPDVVSGEPVLRLWDLSRLVRRDPVLNDTLRRRRRRTRRSARSRPIRDSPSFARRSSDSSTSGAFGARKSSCSRRRASRKIPRRSSTCCARTRARKANRRATRSARRRSSASARDAARWPRSSASCAGRCSSSLLPRVHAAIRYRERARLKQALLYSRCRRIALAMGAELVRRGTIAERDDVFFLTWQELIELTRRRRDVPRLCASDNRDAKGRARASLGDDAAGFVHAGGGRVSRRRDLRSARRE